LKENDKYHLPVMGAEVVEYLIHDPAGIYIDGTCGTGGHAKLITERLSPGGKLICCDLDRRMLKMAERRNMEVPGRIKFRHCGFHQIAEQLASDEKPISGYLLDLGVNSLQLDREYGFAFKSDNPLDMRFDQSTALTAADIINEYTQHELKKIFKEYGELKQAASLATEIVRARNEYKIETTFQLAEIARPLFPRDRVNKGLAKLAQALRIAVNNELENLRRGLDSLTRILKSGGRLVVISYHSLEDRIVKSFIRVNSRESGLPPDLEIVLENREFKLKSLLKKAITPTSQEIENNPRARSAMLRAAAKV
jgi:16S rRNA (cytosine1402-N4)-methyltransferase